jgi:hypothetical protein
MDEKKKEGGKAGPAVRSPSGPRVVVSGVVVNGDKPRPPRESRRDGAGKRAPWLIGLASVAFALVLALATALLAACSGGASASIRADGGLRIQSSASVPAPLAARLRKLANLPEASPLFDVEATRKALAETEGLRLLSLSAADADSLALTLDIADLQSFVSGPRIADSGAVSLSSGTGWKELRVRLARGAAAPLAGLLPGLDPDLVEALSPPALDPEPISRAEYRRMLAGIIGEKAVVSLEGATMTLRLSAPGAVLASSGGKLEGQTLVVAIPALDLLVLEKPIEFTLRWKTN